MRTFHYRGYTAAGAASEGQTEAESAKAALRQLTARGVFVERLQPASSRRTLTSARRSALYRELAALLAAGLPLERALELLQGADDTHASADSGVIATVRDAIRDGASLGEALAGAAPRLGGYERAALLSAERTGSLPPLLVRIAEHLETRAAAREHLRSAAFYPLFVLTLGFGVAFLMLGVLVPRAQVALSAAGVALPPGSLLVVRLARAVAWTGGTGLLGTLLAGGLLRGARRRDVAWQARSDRWRLSLPLLGPAERALAAERFASTMGVLLSAGVPVVDTMGLAGAATDNRWIADQVDAATERVRHGLDLSQALAPIGPLAPWLLEWVRVGEAGGCLDAMLEVAARRAREAWERTTRRWLALFEPLVLTCVGVFVLAVALAVLLPVLSLTRAIG